MLMIIYVSGTYDYLFIHESYVNLIWYLYVFLLNKLCLSLSLSLNMNGVNQSSAFFLITNFFHNEFYTESLVDVLEALF